MDKASQPSSTPSPLQPPSAPPPPPPPPPLPLTRLSLPTFSSFGCSFPSSLITPGAFVTYPAVAVAIHLSATAESAAAVAGDATLSTFCLRGLRRCCAAQNPVSSAGLPGSKAQPSKPLRLCAHSTQRPRLPRRDCTPATRRRRTSRLRHPPFEPAPAPSHCFPLRPAMTIPLRRCGLSLAGRRTRSASAAHAFIRCMHE